MVLHNPNNWHWVNKDTSGWARDYLESELIGVSAEGGAVFAKIDKILSMEGDVDVSQRKGKVITLFDVRLQLEYSGKTKEDEEVSGTITVPELAHDTEADEYVFDIDIYSESANKQPVKDLIRAKITPQLREKMQTLGPALIAAHGKDIQHAKDQDPNKSFMAPKYLSGSSINKSESQSGGTHSMSGVNGSSGPRVNTTTVTDTGEFRTTAQELYTTFTDPGRIAAFTRAPPKLFEGAKVGGKFELFGGNVSGEYVELEQPTRLVQKWRLQQWPQGHFSRLDIRFDQNDVDAVTNMRVEWTGVPIGQEEVTKKNWSEYYIRSIKTTFGFGAIL